VIRYRTDVFLNTRAVAPGGLAPFSDLPMAASVRAAASSPASPGPRGFSIAKAGNVVSLRFHLDHLVTLGGSVATRCGMKRLSRNKHAARPVCSSTRRGRKRPSPTRPLALAPAPHPRRWGLPACGRLTVIRRRILIAGRPSRSIPSVRFSSAGLRCAAEARGARVAPICAAWRWDRVRVRGTHSRLWCADSSVRAAAPRQSVRAYQIRFGGQVRFAKPAAMPRR